MKVTTDFSGTISVTFLTSYKTPQVVEVTRKTKLRSTLVVVNLLLHETGPSRLSFLRKTHPFPNTVTDLERILFEPNSRYRPTSFLRVGSLCALQGLHSTLLFLFYLFRVPLSCFLLFITISLYHNRIVWGFLRRYSGFSVTRFNRRLD